MYLQIASVRNKLFSRSQSKTEKLLERVVSRKIDPIFPLIHYLNRPAGEHDGVLARTFRWVGRRDSILFLFKNSMRVRQWGSRHFSLPKSPLSHSFIGVEVEKGAIQARRQAKKAFCSISKSFSRTRHLLCWFHRPGPSRQKPLFPFRKLLHP